MDSAQENQFAEYINALSTEQLVQRKSLLYISNLFEHILRSLDGWQIQKRMVEMDRIMFFQQIATRKPKLNMPLHAGCKTGFVDGSFEISSTSPYNCGSMQSLLVHPTCWMR